MIRLSSEQRLAVDVDGHAVVTACPGSGKTRVLTCRLIRGLEEMESTKRRIAALTFTNRAADEIKARLDQFGVNLSQLWAGTIHAFALEWILRPYKPYAELLKRGFSIADEYYTRKLLRQLKHDAGVADYYEVNLAFTRDGDVVNANPTAQEIAKLYRKKILNERLLDYNDVLYVAYRLLRDKPEISETLAHIFELVCVDEVQDTQDLQYGILSEIARADAPCPIFFFVGDPNQSIYESLGAVNKTAAEIKKEFGFASISSLGLTGNYRSSQQVIDYYRLLRPGVEEIEALSAKATLAGEITFADHKVAQGDLAKYIADLIGDLLNSGVPQEEICVLAPQWWHVIGVARDLTRLLPDVDFDAPGLSPLHSQRENLWFKVARLFLTQPSPPMYLTRLRWAGELLRDLEESTGSRVGLEGFRSRKLLRIVNSIQIEENDGLNYLRICFEELLNALSVEIDLHPKLAESHGLFFEKAEARIADDTDDVPTDVAYFKKVFRHPSGVVISTCHGVKGEEYEAVICFGLLHGYIPHWSAIFGSTDIECREQSSKLLYVVCSRAKTNLHLVAESGRKTRKGHPLHTNEVLGEIVYAYTS